MVEILQGILNNSNELWVQVLLIVGAIGALLRGLEAILSIIAPLTPWKWDDNIAAALGKIIAMKIFKRKAK